jgi:uncharacterized protein YjbI with pentapeptide repeats
MGANLTGARLDDVDLSVAGIVGPGIVGLEIDEVRVAPKVPMTERINQKITRHLEWIQSAGQHGERADFTGADLSYRSLRGLNLAAATLGGAILIGTDLSGSLLAAANLRGAVLIRADLRGADLRGADLMDADMRLVKLTGCKKGALPGTGLFTLLKEAI